MKTTRTHTFLAVALALAGGAAALAQSNNVPGPTDYARFAQFITQRNIFNPARYAIVPGERPHFTPPPRNAPQFTLVGIMSYAKGMFAFFDGNQSNLRKVLYASDTNGIAGYVVTGITATNVTLQSADQKETLALNIGQSMRQEGGSWQLAMQGGFFDGRSSAESAAPAAENSGADTSAAPSSAIAGNDVLKRLMQQRQQELK